MKPEPKKPRGLSDLSIPLALAAAAVGLAAGAGGFAFHYAKGSSYLGNDPAACANCHVMQEQYAGWQASSHHQVATCNDCHTPHPFLAKYAVKALNGWNHSLAFTLGGYPDVIEAKPASKAVVEANCRRCHETLVDSIGGTAPAHGGGLSCVRCHASAGHLR